MVLSAIVHATLADVVSEEKRAQAFFHMASVTLLSEVIAPPLGSILMEAQGVYAPLIYGFPLQVLSIAVLFMLPRSVDVAKDSNDAQSDIGGIANLPSEQDAKPAGLKTIARKVSRKLMTSWMLVRNNGNVLVVAASFLATFLGKDTLDFLVQYVSKRFSWSLAKVCRHITAFVRKHS
jgi:predicted MFS family arabinose efflux permease